MTQIWNLGRSLFELSQRTYKDAYAADLSPIDLPSLASDAMSPIDPALAPPALSPAQPFLPVVNWSVVKLTNFAALQVAASIAALDAVNAAANARTTANRKAVRPVKREKNREARKDYNAGTTVSERNAAVDAAARRSSIVDGLVSSAGDPCSLIFGYATAHDIFKPTGNRDDRRQDNVTISNQESAGYYGSPIDTLRKPR